jgi:hypothetical protein
MTENTRPVFVRRQGEHLKDSLSVPPPRSSHLDGHVIFVDLTICFYTMTSQD